MNEIAVRASTIGACEIVVERTNRSARDGYVAIPVDEVENVIHGMRKARETVEERRDGPFVQVRFLNGGSLYTYRDPSDRCEVGDLVEVPTGYDNTISLARVEKFGRGSAVKRARIVKEVHSILQREVL